MIVSSCDDVVQVDATSSFPNHLVAVMSSYLTGPLGPVSPIQSSMLLGPETAFTGYGNSRSVSPAAYGRLQLSPTPGPDRLDWESMYHDVEKRFTILAARYDTMR